MGEFLEELRSLRTHLDELFIRFEGRVDVLEKSVLLCQSTCGQERRKRGAIAKWLLYLVAATVPGLVVYLFEIRGWLHNR
jgi:hypothetical protein